MGYRIKPKKGLKENTIIENTAAIYFDFNPPIITNTTQNTMVSKLPQKQSLESAFQELPILLYPNPASDLITIELEYMDTETSYEARLFNSLGQMVARRDFNYKRILQMDTENLPTGIYFVAVRDQSREKMVTYQKVLLAKPN
ncbi:MAG: T9SS type A sorting domain-containing protein [Bacteroidota bacterium]